MIVHTVSQCSDAMCNEIVLIPQLSTYIGPVVETSFGSKQILESRSRPNCSQASVTAFYSSFVFTSPEYLLLSVVQGPVGKLEHSWVCIGSWDSPLREILQRTIDAI
jgi:hypothetical protein